MRTLHLEKKGLRGLAIAESFRQRAANSIFSGVVMRRDFVIDGFVFGTASIEGDDATDTVLKMYDELQRPDVGYVLISGLIVSMFNIIDIKKLYHSLKIPIIGILENIKMNKLENIASETENLGLKFLGEIPYDPEVEDAIGDVSKLHDTMVAKKIRKVAAKTII